MKGFNILGAFLSGAIVGAVFGILFAPEKGEDTRELIAQKLRDKGIKLSKSDLDELVDEIASEVKEIANFHSGELTVESELGKGSTFTLKIEAIR